MESVSFLNFVINAVIIVVLLLFSRENLARVRNILDILNNGSYHNCPFYRGAKPIEGGRRWYDNQVEKGGENLCQSSKE